VAAAGYLLIGNLIYGGAGAGIGYLGDFGWQDPFFALRAGVDFMAGRSIWTSSQRTVSRRRAIWSHSQ